MTNDHIRKSLILLFILNVALLYQNWQTGRNIKSLEATIHKAVDIAAPITKSKLSDGTLIDGNIPSCDKTDVSLVARNSD